MARGLRVKVSVLRQRGDRGYQLRTRGSERTTKFRAANVTLARTQIIENFQTHIFNVFFDVLRMYVSPQNAVINFTLSLQIEFSKFQKVFSE